MLQRWKKAARLDAASRQKAEAELANARAELTAAEAQLANREQDQAAAGAEKLRRQACEAALAAAQAEAADTQADLAEAARQLASSRAELASRQAEAGTLTADLAAARQQRDSTKQGLARAETAAAYAQNELGTVKSRLQAAESQAKTRDAKLAAVSRALSEERGQLQQTGSDLADAHRSLADHEPLRQDCAKLQHVVTCQMEQLAASTSRAEAASAEAAELRGSLELRLTELRDVSQQLAQAKQQAQQVKSTSPRLHECLPCACIIDMAEVFGRLQSSAALSPVAFPWTCPHSHASLQHFRMPHADHTPACCASRPT